MGSNSVTPDVYQILNIFFNIINKDFDNRLLLETVINHESPNSLSCLSDTLHDFNIYNISVKSTLDRLYKIDLISIVHIEQNGEGKFLIFKKIQGNKIILIDQKGANKTFEITEFTSLWSGLLLISNESNKSLEGKLFTLGKKQIDLSIILILFSTIFIVCILRTSSLNVLLLFLFKASGIFFSWLLIQKENNIPNKFADQICSINGNFNCNAVLGTSGGVFLKKIKLSEIAFFYFFISSITLLSTFLLGHVNFVLAVNKIITWAILGIVIYTILYQLIVIKKWCPLCLLLSGCFLLEFTFFRYFQEEEISLDYSTVLFTLLICITFGRAFFTIKHTYKNFQIYKSGYLELSRLKKKQNILTPVLHSKPIKINSYSATDIILGNSNASSTIIEVINPSCRPCAKLLGELTKLLNSGKFKLIIRFAGIPQNQENENFKVVSNLILLYSELPSEKFIEAILFWYNSFDYSSFVEKYPLQIEIPNNVLEKINNDTAWIQDEGIRYTPSTIIDGYLWPKEFNKNDLIYFIDNFIE